MEEMVMKTANLIKKIEFMKSVYMNFILIISIMFLTLGCTRTLEVETLVGVEKLEFPKKEIVEESVNVEKYDKPTVEDAIETCYSPGVCCKCGFTMEMEHECSCGMWRNCPGKQEVKLERQNYFYRKLYKVKKGDQVSEYKSPLYQGSKTKTLSSGSCNQ